MTKQQLANHLRNRIRRLPSARAHRMLSESTIVTDPCGQCGHERVSHVIGGGECGAIVERVDGPDGEPYEAGCWCGRFKTRKGRIQ